MSEINLIEKLELRLADLKEKRESKLRKLDISTKERERIVAELNALQGAINELEDMVKEYDKKN